MPATQAVVNHLLTRRSVTMLFLGPPGPNPAELEVLLTIATRVPDHGKLAPWRLIVFEGAARVRAGDKLQALALVREPGLSPERIEEERNRFLPAPLTVGVVSKAAPHEKIPEFEQLLSAANVCFNLVHGAHALGFAAQWVTRWFAYDAEASRLLGVRDGERFAGFVHIGTPTVTPPDRERPALADVVTRWAG
ncbi:MAG: nitroreductase [Cucumibacter sp.]